MVLLLARLTDQGVRPSWQRQFKERESGERHLVLVGTAD